MLTRQNVIDLESSGKMENFQESSFREKNARSALAYNPKGMMGNRQDNNGGRCSGLFFGNMCVKSTRLERI